MNLKDMIIFLKKYCGGEKKLFIKSFVFLFTTSMIGTLYGYLFGLAIDKARVSSFGLTIAVLFLIYIIDFIDNLFFNQERRNVLWRIHLKTETLLTLPLRI